MRLPSISSAVFGVFFQQVCSLKSLTLLVSMEKMRFLWCFHGWWWKATRKPNHRCTCNSGWVCFTCSIVFGSLKALKLLRVNAEDEELGLDSSHHG